MAVVFCYSGPSKPMPSSYFWDTLLYSVYKGFSFFFVRFMYCKHFPLHWLPFHFLHGVFQRTKSFIFVKSHHWILLCCGLGFLWSHSRLLPLPRQINETLIRRQKNTLVILTGMFSINNREAMKWWTANRDSKFSERYRNKSCRGATANGEWTRKEISKSRSISPTKAETKTSKGRRLAATGAVSLLCKCWKAPGDPGKWCRTQASAGDSSSGLKIFVP